MPVEVELKYGADGRQPLDRLASEAVLGAAALGPVRRVVEVDRYLDTPDLRLSAARWACRLRRRDGQILVSLKGPAAAATGGGLHRRPELEGPASAEPDPSTWPPSAARELVDRLRGGGPLIERFRLDQLRTERPVLLHDARVGTLSLDEVTVSRGGQARGMLHAVELELDPGEHASAEAVLAELDAALRAIDGLRPDGLSKLEHALAIVEDR